MILFGLMIFMVDKSFWSSDLIGIYKKVLEGWGALLSFFIFLIVIREIIYYLTGLFKVACVVKNINEN